MMRRRRRATSKHVSTRARKQARSKQNTRRPTASVLHARTHEVRRQDDGAALARLAQQLPGGTAGVPEEALFLLFKSQNERRRSDWPSRSCSVLFRALASTTGAYACEQGLRGYRLQWNGLGSTPYATDMARHTRWVAVAGGVWVGEWATCQRTASMKADNETRACVRARVCVCVCVRVQKRACGLRVVVVVVAKQDERQRPNARVHARGGLVEEHHGGAANEGDGHGQLALLPAAHVVRDGILLVRQPDSLLSLYLVSCVRRLWCV